MIPKSAVYMLLALSLLLFLPKLGMPLLDPDEGLYAEIADQRRVAHSEGPKSWKVSAVSQK